MPEGYNRRPTLRDVAKEAGVSAKTVSRVINREQVVSPATAERVTRTISSLGYQPDELARSLKTRRSQTVGLLIADISNPFYAKCAKAIEEVTRKQGYALILCASDENVEVERAYLDLLNRRRVDGLLLIPATGKREPEQERTAEFPVVAFDRPLEAYDTDTILAKNRRGTREAIEHLIGHGHRSIAFVGGQERTYTVEKRFEGYLQAIGEEKIEEMSRFGAVDIETATGAALDLLKAPEPPTAFFAWNNLATVGVLSALSHVGLRVPDDVAVIGFDDFELGALLYPRLTLVRQPAAALGRHAAELLFERLKGRQFPYRRVVLDTELMIRDSCGCKHPT